MKIILSRNCYIWKYAKLSCKRVIGLSVFEEGDRAESMIEAGHLLEQGRTFAGT